MFLIVALFSCQKEETDPLIARLTNTTWSVEKTELIENGIVTRTLLPDPKYHMDKLSFELDDRVYIVSPIGGCGEWTISKERLQFRIFYGQISSLGCSEGYFVNVYLLFRGKYG